MGNVDAQDERLLDQAVERAVELAGQADEDVVRGLPGVVRDALAARRADGSWPPAELVQEVLRSSWDVLAERVRALLAEAGPYSDTARLVDAWRHCADDLAILTTVLDQVRAERDDWTMGNYLLDDLALLGEPSPTPDDRLD